MNYVERMVEQLGGMLGVGVGHVQDLTPLGVMLVFLMSLLRISSKARRKLTAVVVRACSFLVIYKPRGGLLRFVVKGAGSHPLVSLTIYWKKKNRIIDKKELMIRKKESKESGG